MCVPRYMFILYEIKYSHFLESQICFLELENKINVSENSGSNKMQIATTEVKYIYNISPTYSTRDRLKICNWSNGTRTQCNLSRMHERQKINSGDDLVNGYALNSFVSARARLFYLRGLVEISRRFEARIH